MHAHRRLMTSKAMTGTCEIAIIYLAAHAEMFYHCTPYFLSGGPLEHSAASHERSAHTCMCMTRHLASEHMNGFF